MMKTTKRRTRSDRAVRTPQMQLAHRIEALLRTMRVIERHEEHLCVVMTEIRSAGDVSAATRNELRSLLEELPGDIYQADLDAVSKALAVAENDGAEQDTEGGVPKSAASRSQLRAKKAARRKTPTRA